MTIRPTCAALFLATTLCSGQGTSLPAITGYITRAASASDFDVNGLRVGLTGDVPFTVAQYDSVVRKQVISPVQAGGAHIFLGEPVEIFGKVNRKTHTIEASRVLLHARSPHEISGSGIIDAVLPLSAGTSATDCFIRADGYPVLLTASTKTKFDKPLTSLADIDVNVWAAFHGVQRPDGIVVADDVLFVRNTVKQTEDHLKQRTEYDPNAVPDDSKQSGASKFFKGVDVRQIPPSKDTAMQERVAAIGARLVPKYQSSLPLSDPNRINFRFQVVDDNKDTDKWHDAFTLPNGIILVPHHVVERLQNDTQIAVVLADNIACALEKQPLSGYEFSEKRTAVAIAADLGGVFVPFLGLAPILPGMAAEKHLLHKTEDQSGRVSIWLLHDAGYDVTQAPITWWLLAPKEQKDIAEIPLPRRAASLYDFLGNTWPID